ncbi:MAG: DUF2085 domain-containing protein [Candidatus Aminicenantes bacterium]|nr:DUF2085 domain-containing protein [Candidatus Aminicenantes bacterium]
MSALFHNRIQIILWLGSLLLSALILAGIFLAPYLRESRPAWSVFLYHLFSSVCHQRPERSFFLQGQPLAVCSRCLGFYSGFFLGLLSYPWLPSALVRRLENRAIIILVAAVPLVVDALGGLLGLWWSPPELRLVTGLLWALFLPVFWLKALRQVKPGKTAGSAG